jgi:uncharacterized protein (DUF983 family)
MADTVLHEVDRPLKPALIKGLRMRCPHCGEGHLLHKYLKVQDSCSHCGTDFTPQRADDGPAYLTILIVGHVMGLCLTYMWEYLRPSPLVMALVLSAIAVVSALMLLPRMKGLVVAWQWAKRMHGF